MPSKLTVAAAQVFTQPTLQETLTLLRDTTQKAASQGASLILFPEAFLGGYPRTCSFGATIGNRDPSGYDQFHSYFRSAVDLGDTPLGEGIRWERKELSVNESTGRRGDGTREYLEAVARDTGVFLVTGVVEKAGGSLYCAGLFIDPVKGVVGKRRKVQPTGMERLVWSQGQPSSLKAIVAEIKGVRVVMGSAICWENFMPLLRYSLYAQGVNLWLAPTADGRATWEPLMRTVAMEGRCWVLTANQAVQIEDLPAWTGRGGWKAENSAMNQRGENGVVNGAGPEQKGRRESMSCRTEENHEIAWKGKSVDGAVVEEEDVTSGRPKMTEQAGQSEWASRGGSCIISPSGDAVVGPIWEKKDELLITEIDFDECERRKFDFDATGHYARMDAFKLTVEGLDLNPPP
jgi:nitrilase